MQFFIDSQGTVVNLISSPVYQGSTNACELVLVAPFSASNVIEARFKLPNGITTEPYLMTLQPQPMLIDGKTFNIWRVLLDGTITEYVGSVTVQFVAYQSGYNTNNGNTYNPIALTSYSSTFNVGAGVTPTMPPLPTNNIYQSILAYLSQLNPQYNIMSVTYSAPNAEINTDTAISTLATEPTNAVFKSAGVDFSISNIDGSTGNALYALGANYTQDTGFTMTFSEPQSIGKMQLNISGAYFLTKLIIQATLDDNSVVKVDDITFLAPTAINVIISVNKTVKSISVIQPYTDNVDIDDSNSIIGDKGFTNGRFYINAVKLWQPSTNGQITITSSTGRTLIFPDANYDLYVSKAQNAQAQAEQSAIEAQNALNEINSKAGQEGGYPVLEMIGGQPKIPSVYINLVNTTTFITIENESELDTLDAPVGSVARLVTDIDDIVVDGETVENIGAKTVTKSFVKLQEGTGTSNWALYASSYADNASNALYAEQATNALRVNNLNINGVLTEADYNALSSKQGVYFVSIEGETND